MPVKHFTFLLFLFFSFPKAKSQSTTPLRGNTPIAISFTQDGLLTQAPAGFELIENKKYELTITVEKPEQKKIKLWKFVADKCKAVVDRLDDPDDALSAQYAAIYSAAQLLELRGQLSELNTVLTNTDPPGAFNKSTNTFSFLQGYTFLQKNLFGSIFSVYNSIDKTTTLYDVNKDCQIIRDITCEEDSFKLEIRVADLTKQFVRNYFLSSRENHKALFDGLVAKTFYKNVGSLSLLKTNIDSLLKVLQQHDVNNPLICEDDIVKRYEELAKAYDDNELLNIIKSNWISEWFWYTGGEWILNPIGFTSKKALILKPAFDENSAKQYDDYINSSIKLMETDIKLGKTRVNYQHMDSLMKERGKGRERFSNKALNNAIESNNNDLAIKNQTIDSTIHKIIFKTVPEKEANKFYIRSYDANKKLKGNNKDKEMPIPNDVTVDVVAYNMLASQDLTLKETAVDIKDQSKAIAQLNEIGDVATAAFENAGKVSSIFPSFIGLLANDDPKFNPITITPSVSVGFSVLSLDENIANNKNFKKFNLKTENTAPGVLRLKIRADKTVVGESANLLALVDRYLAEKGLDKCQDFVNAVRLAVQLYLNKIDVNHFSDEDPSSKITKDIKMIETALAKIIETEFNKNENKRRNFKSILEDLITKSITLGLVDSLVVVKANYTLPPAEFKSEADDVPKYRNKFETLAIETTAKRKDFELVVTDKKTKEEIKRKDSYKTAPKHWVTGSLGVSYVFEPFRRSDAVITNGVITNTPDEDQIRLITGLHFYPYPILLADDRTIFKMKGWREVRTRLSVFTGVSFPKPLYNLHTGISADIWTGVRLTTGVHFFRQTTYDILNGQIADENSKYVYNGIFTSLTIEPVTFVKLIGFLK